MDIAELENRFTYHAPDPAKARAHETVRNTVRNLAVYLDSLLTDGREKSLVMTHLEEATFWANASLARNDFEPKAA